MTTLTNTKKSKIEFNEIISILEKDQIEMIGGANGMRIFKNENGLYTFQLKSGGKVVGGDTVTKMDLGAILMQIGE